MGTFLGIPIEIIAALVGIAGVVLASLWRTIGMWQKKRVFQNLILRELEEFTPAPPKTLAVDQLEIWTAYTHNKEFIHPKILTETDGNLDFILSLDPELVYFVSQLWYQVKIVPNDPKQFMHFWCEIEKYCRKRTVSTLGFPRYRGWREIEKARNRWFTSSPVGRKYDLDHKNCPDKQVEDVVTGGLDQV